MKTLYIDCFSGISGDMFIGALLDAGADPITLERELKKLKFEDEYKLIWKKVNKNGITSTKFDVELTTTHHGHSHARDHSHDHEHSHAHDHNHDHEHSHAHDHSHDHEHSHAHDHNHDHEHSHAHDHNHDHEHSHAHDHSHDHEHSHAHDHNHDHEHSHAHDHNHDHEHSHTHYHSHDHEHSHTHDHNHDHDHSHGHNHDHSHAHGHHHRSYKDIVKMIQTSELAEEVKETALKIFRKIGEAEGHIHGMPLEEVHFHEVGAVDSIIDIVGAAILIHQLDIKIIKSAAIPVGSGKIHIDHGIYPVPAPATLEILKGVPIQQSDVKFELTTPTGAAIAAVLAEEFCVLPSMKVQAIGYGAGTKTFKDHPNLLRVVIGE